MDAMQLGRIAVEMENQNRLLLKLIESIEKQTEAIEKQNQIMKSVIVHGMNGTGYLNVRH